VSGVVINLGITVGCHNGSFVMPMSTANNLKNAEPSILPSLTERHRMTKARIGFRKLSMVERNQFYKEAVDQALSCQTRNLGATEEAR
jgi:hypothetical protein